MEWQFRKILESTENYRSGSPRFMASIEKNSAGVLKTIVRQIQLIMSDPNANIFSKVLAMRFARDIMILGRQDVINELTKLVPHMLKVCSYRIQSDDQNRGESYFYDHPQYLNANLSEKEVIQSYGSTYFILNLQSIFHWGNWIKVDESGNQSIYSKGLNTLVERGVRFPTNFNYYKNSDTEKFKNTYRVQFFSEESANFDSQMQSSFARSDRSSQNDNQFKQLNNVEGIMNSLRSIQHQNPRRFLKLEALKKNAVTLLQKKYHPSMVYYGKQKSDKKWLQNFIVYHNLLTQRKISYEQFIKRANSQTIQIPEKTQYELLPQQLTETNGFKKTKTSAKRQMLQKAPDELTKQHETYQEIINKFKTEVKQLTQIIQDQKAQSQSQKHSIIQNYEERIRNIKQETAYNNSGKNEIMIKENEKLKEKLFDLERSLQVSRSREVQINNTVAAYDMLKIENQNLKKLNKKTDGNINTQERNQFIERIKYLQRELQNAKNQNQIILAKLPIQNDLNRKNKQISQLTDELTIYKNSLQSERNDFDKKYKQLQIKYHQSQNQIRNLKQKNKVLQKKLDLRDIEAVQLGEQMKLFRALGAQQKHSKSRTSPKDDLSQKKSHTNEIQVLGTLKLTNNKPVIAYNFKKYENLKNFTFKNEKQRYLRFCRCSLKKKDLLLKQNQLEVGLISEPISSNEVKFIIHLTNTSESQINQIKISCETAKPGEYQLGLQTEYIFCLQNNEQQKITLLCRSSSNFMTQEYDPIILTISFIKNSRNFETKLALPFLLFKTLEFYKIDKRLETNLHRQYSLTFPYSQKMISEGKYLHSYFPPIQQTSSYKYQCDCLWRQTGSRFRLEFQLKEEKKMTIVVSPLGESKANPKQQQLLEQDLMSFLEFCFRKQ